MANYCMACGAEALAGGRFCHICGARLFQGQSSASSAQSESMPPVAASALPVWTSSCKDADVDTWEKNAVSLATEDFNALRIRFEAAIRNRGEIENPPWAPTVDPPFTDKVEFLNASLALFASCGPSAVFEHSASQFIWLAYLLGDFDFKGLRAANYLALYGEMIGEEPRCFLENRWPAPSMPADACSQNLHACAPALFGDPVQSHAGFCERYGLEGDVDAEFDAAFLESLLESFRNNVKGAYANLKKLKKEAENVRRSRRVRQDSLIAASRALSVDVASAGFYAFQAWDSRRRCLWCYTAADFDANKTLRSLLLADYALLKGMSVEALLPDWYQRNADGTLAATIPPQVKNGGATSSMGLEDVFDLAVISARWVLKIASKV